jgi:hypothetical protein
VTVGALERVPLLLSLLYTLTPTPPTTRLHITMSSDYEFSDDEDYNEYDDDEEAMDVEGGPSYLFPSVVPNNLIMAHFSLK